MIRSKSDSLNRSIATLTSLILILTPALVADEVAGTDKSQTLPIEVPVKVVASAESSSATQMMQPEMAQEAPTEPTTPGGKFPQYQLNHQQRNDDAAVAESTIRLILALPEQPILVEARITVNGEPFRQMRENRVEDVLLYASNRDAWQDKQRQKRAEEIKAGGVTAAADAVTSGLGDVLQQVKDVATAIDISEVPEPDSEAPEDGDPAAEDSEDGEASTDAESGDDARDVGDEPEGDAPVKEAGSEAIEGGGDEGEEAEPEVAPVEEYVAPNSIYERIERYVAATGEKPSTEEVRWLITNWVDGPVLLFLNDNFQRFRADQKPVFKVLDRDRDGKVSAEELEMAVTSFRECDLNRNDIVEHIEIGEVAMDPRDHVSHAGDGKLVYIVPDESSAAGVCRQLTKQYKPEELNDLDQLLTNEEPKPVENPMSRFDVNKNGNFDADELQRLHNGEPDVRVEIAFNSTEADSSRLKVTSVSSLFADSVGSVSMNPTSLSMNFGKIKVEFSAVQGESSDQISIGAVNDGYPMLPIVDPNDDGRFTIRELRRLNDLLATFDINADGALTSDETESTVRLCFGLGPTVHSELAGLRSIQGIAKEPEVKGPPWFVQMDANKDNDLTRAEFKGNDQQFADVDTDHDELVSAEEANALMAAEKENQEQPEKEET